MKALWRRTLGARRCGPQAVGGRASPGRGKNRSKGLEVGTLASCYQITQGLYIWLSSSKLRLGGLVLATGGLSQGRRWRSAPFFHLLLLGKRTLFQGGRQPWALDTGVRQVPTPSSLAQPPAQWVGGSLVPFPTPNPLQLLSSPGKTVVLEGREIVILSWSLASDQERWMAVSGPGHGVGEQNQSHD